VRRDSRVALDPPYQRPVLDPPYRHAPSDGPNQPALRQRVGRYAHTRVPPWRGVRRDSRVALDPPYRRPVLDPPYRHAPSDGPN